MIDDDARSRMSPLYYRLAEFFTFLCPLARQFLYRAEVALHVAAAATFFRTRESSGPIEEGRQRMLGEFTTMHI